MKRESLSRIDEIRNEYRHDVFIKLVLITAGLVVVLGVLCFIFYSLLTSAFRERDSVLITDSPTKEQLVFALYHGMNAWIVWAGLGLTSVTAVTGLLGFIQTLIRLLRPLPNGSRSPELLISRFYKRSLRTPSKTGAYATRDINGILAILCLHEEAIASIGGLSEFENHWKQVARDLFHRDLRDKCKCSPKAIKVQGVKTIEILQDAPLRKRLRIALDIRCTGTHKGRMVNRGPFQYVCENGLVFSDGRWYLSEPFWTGPTLPSHESTATLGSQAPTLPQHGTLSPCEQHRTPNEISIPAHTFAASGVCTRCGVSASSYKAFGYKCCE